MSNAVKRDFLPEAGRRTRWRLCAGLVVLAAWAPQAVAAVVPYSFNWDIENKTGGAAHDFHVTIVSDKVLTHVKSFKGAFNAPTVNQQAGGFVYDVSWAGGPVADNVKTHVGLEFKGDTGAKISVINIRWTAANGRQQGPADKQPTFPGFQAKPLFGFAMNNTASVQQDPLDPPPYNPDLLISNMRFALVDQQVPLEDMMAGLLGGPAEGPFSLPLNGEFTGPWLTLPSVLPDTGLLLMEGVSSYSGVEGTIQNTFLMQVGLPEPTTCGLLMAGAGLLGLRRKTRGASSSATGQERS